MATKYSADATISGSLHTSGGKVTINEASEDFDFRVESNGNTHMLFVDAGNDKVGIGTDSPSSTLHVYANVSSDYAAIIDNDQASSGHGLKVTSDGSGTGTYILDLESGTTNLMRVRADGSVGIGTTTIGQKLTVEGDIGVATNIVHKGDSDTYVGFDTDEIVLYAGGRGFLKCTEDSTDKLMVNYGGLDMDFQVKGENQANLIRTDAANDKVGINTSTPAGTLHVSSSGDTSLIVQGVQDVVLGLVADTNNAGGEDLNPSFYMSQETDTAGAYQVLMGLEGTANLSYTGSYTNQPFILSLNSEDHSSLRTFQIATSDGSDVASRFSIATGGRVAIGDSVQAADARLHIKEAAGDIFKMENTTAYGVTYGQLVKESLTLSDGGSPIDTTLNLPAASMITDVLITIKTAGVGDAHTIDNVALTYGGSTSNIKGSSFSGLSLINNPSQGVAANTQYVVGNTDQSFPAGRATMLLAGAADVKLVYTDTNITTEPIVDVVVFYKKFDTS